MRIGFTVRGSASRPGPARRRLTAALAAGVALLAAACGGGGNSAQSTGPLSGSLTIGAASSLTAAFNTEKADFTKLHPQVRLTMYYAGSQNVATSIRADAPIGVFASADTIQMNEVEPGWVPKSAPKVFADNLLEIAVRPGNPKHIKTLADLARPGLSVVLCDVSVPAGQYGDQALKASHVVVHPKSYPLNVTEALADVQTGNADATIVYVTDVLNAGKSVTGVPIPRAQNVLARYPIASLVTAQNPRVAQAFVAYILSRPGQATLRSFGFLPPT